MQDHLLDFERRIRAYLQSKESAATAPAPTPEVAPA